MRIVSSYLENSCGFHHSQAWLCHKGTCPRDQESDKGPSFHHPHHPHAKKTEKYMIESESTTSRTHEKIQTKKKGQMTLSRQWFVHLLGLLVLIACLHVLRLVHWEKKDGNLFVEESLSKKEKNTNSTRAQPHQAIVPQRRKLLFLHYHKTGHVLCRTLARMGFRVDTENVFRGKTNKVDRVMELQRHSSAPILVLSATNLSRDWDTWLNPTTTRLVHFVRDPLDWCLSAYLYHRQNPPPPLEQSWLLGSKRDKHRCAVQSFRSEFLQAINLTLPARMEMSRLCHSLSNVSALWPQLQQLSTEDGLRLEAARALLGASHGDVMMMAQHLWLANNSHHNSHILTVTLEQFTSSKESFVETVTEICRFGLDHLVLTQRTVQQCVDESVRRGWIGHNNHNHNNNKTLFLSQHVTANQLSSTERSRLRQMLLKDPVLGKPLESLRNFVQDHIR